MSSKIRILFMINNLYGGGAEKILQTLLGQLDQSKYDITLYGVKSETPDFSLYPKGVTYRSVFDWYSGSSILKSFLVKLKNKIKLLVYYNLSPKLFYKLFIKGTYDVEVAFIEGYSTKIISGSPHKSIKISWVHIDLEANHWTTISYKSVKEEIKAYEKFNHIISVSRSVQDAFTRKFGIVDHLSVKYNPVDREEIIKKSSENSEFVINNTASKTQLVTVGRLEPQKGYDRLIKVMHRIKSENFDVHLTIIGEGNQREALEKLVADFELQDTITLLGFQSNPYKFIKKSDIFICSSRSEGFSTVVTEALILGKPVVATDCSGMMELLGDNEYGLVTENNEDSLFLGMKKILSEGSVFSHYKEKSEERSRDFDIKKTMTELEKLWR